MIPAEIWIGVMPNEHTNVIGLSKYARLVDWIMGRPQIPGRNRGATRLTSSWKKTQPMAWPS